MKKIITLGSLLLGVVFLSGCGQQPVSQTQSTAPAVPTPTPVSKTAPVPVTEKNKGDMTNWKTYANNKYG